MTNFAAVSSHLKSWGLTHVSNETAAGEGEVGMEGGIIKLLGVLIKIECSILFSAPLPSLSISFRGR